MTVFISPDMKAATGFNYTSEELMEFARRDDTEIREV